MVAAQHNRGDQRVRVSPTAVDDTRRARRVSVLRRRHGGSDQAACRCNITTDSVPGATRLRERGGKTGTTDNYTDPWFSASRRICLTSQSGSSIREQDSATNVGASARWRANVPATLWHYYMRPATQGDCAPFPQPTSRSLSCPSAQVQSGGSGQPGFSGNGNGAAAMATARATAVALLSTRGGGGGAGTARRNCGNAVDPCYKQTRALRLPSSGSPARPPKPTPRGNGNVTGGCPVGPSGLDLCLMAKEAALARW